jgi:hypothetical protein
VEPRFGRLYASAVLRPLAEQVVDALGARPGEIGCDLICDAGTLGLAFAAAVGSRGRVLLVDTDAEPPAAAQREISRSGGAAMSLVAADHVIPVTTASCDRVASLLTVGFWDGASLFDEADRIRTPAGSAAIVTWDETNPPAHEVALDGALRAEAGLESRFLRACRPPVSAPEQWETVALRDVVRFDGMAHYWVAMVQERPVATEIAAVPSAAMQAVRIACERALRAFIAADGTMRIPVAAVMLRRSG